MAIILIREGRTLFEAKKYTEAIQKLNEALDKTDNIQQQADVHFWLGRCYLEQALQTKDAALFDKALEHHQKQLALAEKLNGEDGIQGQAYSHFWLGRCYLGQALQTKDAALIGNSIEHHQEQLILAKQLNKGNSIQDQFNAQAALGHCYWEQAMQSKDAGLFKKTIKHYQEQLILAKQLDGADSIQKQIHIQSWLGRCYLEQALQNQNKENKDLFHDAIKHHQEQLKLAKQLNEGNDIQEQIYAESWLGRCYLEQALQTKNKENKGLFNKAIEYFQALLELAEKLTEENGIQEQVTAQFWLGYCYFKQALQTKDTTLFSNAIEHHEEQLALAKQLDGEDGIQEQLHAQFWLGCCYLEQIKQNAEFNKDIIKQSEDHFTQAYNLLEEVQDKFFKKEKRTALNHRQKELYFISSNYQSYFNSKQQDIQEKLPTKIAEPLKENIASILAVLSIAPIEFDKPLAHYTSPTVCEKLLGIDPKQQNQKNIAVSKMRMNSSTYMNDPYEGQSLLDFLGIYEPALENLTECSSHNAFFACFSARVNDLNQFRLYGKVGKTEASGCCLVFNKSGDWIQEPDISASYQYLNSLSRMADNTVAPETTEVQQPSASLPLYQIAYIFYREEYTRSDEYDVMDSDEIFGVRLKPISNNDDWHEVRKQKLQTALNDLREYFKYSAKNQESKANLEYIRYLFKDYAFRDEEEFRLLKIEDSGSDKVQYCPSTNTTFLEYGDICNNLDEVILGTNYERTEDGRKVEVFRHLLKRKNLNITVSHSSLPINPPMH